MPSRHQRGIEQHSLIPVIPEISARIQVGHAQVVIKMNILTAGRELCSPTTEKPKPELTSDLKGAALTGNSVILFCTVKLQSAEWKFYWIKDTQSRDTETETHSYTIRSVNVSDRGWYRCRAGRGNPVYYTHYSDALWVNVN
ncbi:Fc receptor-like protein 5, partial [Silurus meridionalis]